MFPLTFKDLPAYCSCSLPESRPFIKPPFSWVSYCNPTSLHLLSGLMWHSEVLFSFLQRLILLLMAFMHAYSQMLFHKPCFWAKSKGNQKKTISFFMNLYSEIWLSLIYFWMTMLKTFFLFFFFGFGIDFSIYTDLKRSNSFIVYISNSSLGNYCSYVTLQLIYVLMCSRELYLDIISWLAQWLTYIQKRVISFYHIYQVISCI